jgi:hypothetical protein
MISTLKEVELVIIGGEKFLLATDTINDLWVFNVNDKLSIGYFDDMLGSDIKWVKNVFIENDLIGVVNEDYISETDVFRITPLNQNHIDKIISNGGLCRIEVEERNIDLLDFNPSIHNRYEPVLLDGKVIMHI